MKIPLSYRIRVPVRELITHMYSSRVIQEIKKKDSMNKTDPKFWISKHKKESVEYHKKKSAEPGAGTYKPLPTLYTTFTKLSEVPKSKL